MAAVAEPALESGPREESRTLGDFHVTEFVFSSAASHHPGSSAGLELVLFGMAGSLEREADRELDGPLGPLYSFPLSLDCGLLVDTTCILKFSELSHFYIYIYSLGALPYAVLPVQTTCVPLCPYPLTFWR